MYIVSVDTGGTFTDLAAFDAGSNRLVYAKALTTYGNLVGGIVDCLSKTQIDVADTQLFKHGTTLVINALLQRNGAKSALITTRGFRDILELGRGNRPEPFDIAYRRHPPLIPRDMRFEIDERMSAEGAPVVQPDVRQIAALADELKRLQVDAVAISFLNAYANPAHEAEVASALRSIMPDAYVTTGSELSQEWYEFERTATVAANAYVGPQVARYSEQLDRELGQRGFPGRFFMMGSNGGVISLPQSLLQPVVLVESGPVGGSIGAAAYATALDLPSVISFDMGGTTAKCALVESSRFEVKSSYYIGGYDRGFPIRGAVIDIVEVGAGGGSVAWIDEQSRLHVGPRSAGSTPGPVCYARGGSEPTITDANLVLGRLNPTGFLGGDMDLDADLARGAIQARLAEPLGYDAPDGHLRVAEGMLAIASVIMAGAIKRITVERGRDPRDFCLFAYGGGGPLHAARIARELHIPLVLVPPEPGNFSAVGMLLADIRRDDATTFVRLLDDPALTEMADVFERMEGEMTPHLVEPGKAGDVSFEYFADFRYRGQTHSVLTPVDKDAGPGQLRRRFEELYHKRYGHSASTNPVEFSTLRLVGHGSIERPTLDALTPVGARADAPKTATRPVYFGEAASFVDTMVLQRPDLPVGFATAGPALVEEYGSTTVVGPDDSLEVGRLGELRIHIGRPVG